MGRLFITPREIDFINDLNKELMKDVIGQKIYYYNISLAKSQVHDVYAESVEKIFERPVEIEALVHWEPEDVRTGKFGSEEYTRIEAFLHQRDLVDREIKVTEGDYFSYGTQFFEITSVRTSHNIYGQVEYTGGLRLVGREARKTNFLAKLNGPTDESLTDADAIQKQFVQQRGFNENIIGKTGDTRALQDKGVLEAPITGPGEVSVRASSGSNAGSSFYDET